MSSQLQKISALYCAFFNRAPDKSGLDYWNAAMVDNGGDLEAIAQNFASHPVFASTYGALNNQAFVEAIYKNMLGSAGDTSGIAYWVSELNTGAARADVVANFVTSALEADLHAGLAEGKLTQAEYDQAIVRQAYIANRADVGLYFSEQFGTHSNITTDAVETDRAYIAALSVIANVDSTASSKTVSQNTIDAAAGTGADDPITLLGAMSGISVDGLVKGATVFIDANNNGVLDAGELSTKTDDLGHWSFQNTGANPHAFNGQIVSIGGTDISTNSPVHGSLIAPAGAQVVNALTTLIQIVAATNQLSAADAETLVKSRLNISPAVHLQTFDAIAETSKSGTDATTQAASVKIQSQIVEIETALGEIGALLTGAGVSANKDDGVDAATKALANFIAGSNTVIDLTAVTTAKQLITDATTIAGASASQMANVSSLSSDAAQVITNLSHAIQDAGANSSGSDGKAVLIDIAQIQLVAGAIEQSIENGAKSNDVSAAKIATTGATLTAAIANAASQVGDVNGDNISDAPSTPPVVTHPPVDSVAPTIANVTSSTADGSYGAGESISIQVSFSEVVNVVTSAGTPTLLLETGGTDHTATYASGSGTDTLTFTYVVQAGDTSLDLDFQSSTALALNSGTIKDAAGNAATLTLASPAATGSLGANKDIVIDTTAPTTTIATMAFSVDTGASNTDFNTAIAAQTISGTTSANIASGEIVEVSIDNGSTWTTATTSVGANTWSLAGVTLTGSDTLKVRVADAAGNSGTVASQAYVLDTTPQPLTFTLTAGNDTVPGGTLDDTINGTVAGAFAAADSIDGAGGNDTLSVTDSANIDTTGTTVVNVETASLTSSGTVNAVTTGWTGLTSLTVSAAGAVTVNSGTTALNISETGAGQLTSDIVADGGTSVSVASTHQGTGRITIGGTTAPSGAVTVTSSVDAGQTGGVITVNGGTTVSVTQSSTHAVGTTVTSESAVTVNGGAYTTTVSVTQPSVAAAATTVAAVTGVSAISAVTAAPGTQPVTARTAVAAVSAVTAAAGVAANGAVTIVDSQYNTATPNTISSVTLSSYGAGSAIRSNALTTLSLSGTGGTLTITNATDGAGAVPSTNPTLALTINGLSGTNTITDTNNEITTLNVTATGADSTLAAFADTGLTTLTVAGTQVFRLNSMNSSLTSITVSDAAGFNDGGTTASGGFAARGAAATLTTTSSGAIGISIDATTQSFVGSTGVNTIRISSRVDATQTVTGGSSSSDELILEGGAYALTAATGLKVTGFETLGVSANVTGTIDMSNLAPGFTKLHIIGNSNVAFTKVANNMNLQMDKASTQMTMVMADSTGPADTANVSLGSATSDTVNFGTMIFKDASAVGVGTLNIVSNGVNVTPGDAVANFNSMVITDNGLSNLNVSGTQGLKITTIAQATTQATSFTLNNTDTGLAGVNIGTLTDSKLNSLNFAGTGLSKITTLSASGVATLAIDNSGTQMATLTTMSSTATLTSLTLTGNVQIGDGLVGGTGMTFTSQAGLTISAATDPAHVKITMAGAGSGKTDNITLGNGNNTFTDVTTAGTVNLTVGTGSNFITLGGATTNSTSTYNITLGTHTAGTGPDYITVGTGGTAYATTPNFVITGAVTGDRITFSADGASSSNAPTLATAGATAGDTITAVEAAAATAHGVAYAVFNGNTYIAESNTGTLAATDTTIVELIGTHTLTASTGYLTIAS